VILANHLDRQSDFDHGAARAAKGARHVEQ
jgi:hypothetical protein